MMKKIILWIVVAVMITSCADYLDVQPQSQVDRDVLFSTQEGFMEALIGIYVRGTQNDSYGNEVTFGFLDVLAQNYDAVDYNDTYDPAKYQYEQTMNFNYGDQYFINRKDGTWLALYNAIANCNLLLENIDEKKSLFHYESDYKLIRGEALALRAYLHFDIYRMFAPAYSVDPEAKVIPYVTTYSNAVTVQSSGTEVLNKAIADLLAAKELMRDVDPIYTESYIVGYPGDNTDTEEEGRIFLHNRRHRMNYYAVCGTLARVYLAKNDKPKALEQALEVINSNKFPWTKKEDFNADREEDKDRIMYKELLFAWDIAKRKDDLKDRFREDRTRLNCTVSEGGAIFETGSVGSVDYRYKQWLRETSSGGSSVFYIYKYRRADNNRHPLVAPALRLSEMYYIAAEAAFDTDPEAAWNYFNKVRYNRGIGQEIHGETSRDIFLNELLKECRKEFFAEGQIFYMYKRLNRNIVGQGGISIPASNQIFMLPMPNDEIAFGQRE
jgi:hypothetical protein